jgi:hypothetical protein
MKKEEAIAKKQVKDEAKMIAFADHQKKLEQIKPDTPKASKREQASIKKADIGFSTLDKN